MPRENDIVENYKAYKQMIEDRQKKIDGTIKEEEDKRASFIKEYYSIREKRELTEREKGKLLEECKNYYFANILKGIFIGALEAATLTDDALYLAENTVDNYIKESGGYQTIMNNCKVDTYLLAKIRRLVEDAAEEEVDNIEAGNEEIDAIEKIELQNDPEDEKDSAEVASDTQLTAANITDIVAALNKSGLEVVKKGEDADNFKDGQPETEENKPDIEVSADEKETTTDAIPAEEEKVEVDVEEEQPETAITDAQPAAEEKTEAPAEESEASEQDTAVEASAEEKPEGSTDSSEEEMTEEAPAEESELDADLEVADQNNEENADDPYSIKVYNDEEEEEVDVNLDSDEEGDDDLDELDDEELGDDSDDLGDDDTEDAEDIDIDGDGEPDIGDVEEPEPTVNVDPNKTMMDELENEKEVKDAVELIRARVADAEEAFIKRNQEDKEKMDELLSKISQNVATVEKISSDDKAAEATKKTMEEATIMYKQSITALREDAALPIFDKLTRNISESIIKDPEKVKLFMNESTNTPEVGLMVEAAKVVYAFLETLNTLQLEDVDSKYVLDVINGRK